MKTYLWIDQDGHRYYGTSIAEVKRKYYLSGRTAPMYRDKKDGTTVRVGTVVGSLWLTKFTLVETPAKF